MHPEHLQRISTSALGKLLQRAAAGSAEHRAIQMELADREGARRRPDRATLQLFTAAELEQTTGRKKR